MKNRFAFLVLGAFMIAVLCADTTPVFSASSVRAPQLHAITLHNHVCYECQVNPIQPAMAEQEFMVEERNTRGSGIYIPLLVSKIFAGGYPPNKSPPDWKE